MSSDPLVPPYRIYVVEDSLILLRLLLDMLGGIAGVEIVGHAPNAQDAVAGIVEHRPDAVILDLMLQSGTGFDVLHGLGAATAASPVVIVLTNFTMASYREKAQELGVTYFFDKSTEILQLFRVVSQLVDDRRERYNANRSNHG